MERLYSKQAVISLICLLAFGILWRKTDKAIFLGFAIMFLASYLQCVFDLYKLKK